MIQILLLVTIASAAPDRDWSSEVVRYPTVVRTARTSPFHYSYYSVSPRRFRVEVPTYQVVQGFQPVLGHEERRHTPADTTKTDNTAIIRAAIPIHALVPGPTLKSDVEEPAVELQHVEPAVVHERVEVQQPTAVVLAGDDDDDYDDDDHRVVAGVVPALQSARFRSAVSYLPAVPVNTYRAAAPTAYRVDPDVDDTNVIVYSPPRFRTNVLSQPVVYRRRFGDYDESFEWDDDK